MKGPPIGGPFTLWADGRGSNGVRLAGPPEG